MKRTICFEFMGSKNFDGKKTILLFEDEEISISNLNERTITPLHQNVTLIAAINIQWIFWDVEGEKIQYIKLFNKQRSKKRNPIGY
jgi:hypothetical protein